MKDERTHHGTWININWNNRSVLACVRKTDLLYPPIASGCYDREAGKETGRQTKYG